MKLIRISIFLLLISSIFGFVKTSAAVVPVMPGADDPTPPTETVKLIFIHHSTGENWLADDNGGLALALRANNYFVSDTNSGWGPDGIGDSTDIGHWWLWFRGPNHQTYLQALYNEFDTHSTYTRMNDPDPSRANQIIMFKSCFPNSHLGGTPADPPVVIQNPLFGESSGDDSIHTVGNAKGVYVELLTYFTAHQEKLFIVITAPPLQAGETDTEHAANARALNNWLINDWLAAYPYPNVAVFDFYNVLTSSAGDPDHNDLGAATGNHHRWWNGMIQHVQGLDHNFSSYPTGDSHPSQAGNLKATGEFVTLLNVFYHRWKNGTIPPSQKIYLPLILRGGVNRIGEGSSQTPARNFH